MVGGRMSASTMAGCFSVEVKWADSGMERVRVEVAHAVIDYDEYADLPLDYLSRADYPIILRDHFRGLMGDLDHFKRAPSKKAMIEAMGVASAAFFKGCKERAKA